MPGTNYFSFFPSISYTCSCGQEKVVVDIFKRAKISDMSTTIKTSVFYKYVIRDGEKPEHIAERYYGDTQYYWIILYANSIINIYAQWPKSTVEFEKYIISKYGSIEDASNRTTEDAIHHYEDIEGNWIDRDTWLSTVPEQQYRISKYDYEYKLNEDKREINIIRVEYLRQIVGEMNTIFKSK